MLVAPPCRVLGRFPPNSPLRADLHGATAAGMNATAVKEFTERQPFRPFAVRLSNGQEYAFVAPWDVGAPRSCREIYFDDSDRAPRRENLQVGNHLLRAGRT